VFRLKKGMKFHDGREVTSKDVKTTIDYIMNPANKSNFQISYSVWVGANNDPDVFDLVFSSERIPPNEPAKDTTAIRGSID
jgi:ABC-type transport system substrate-binding protein